MSQHAKQPWVLIAGGFHRKGGMDKANLVLAEHLVGAGHPVHVISHSVDAHLSRHPLVRTHVAPRPFGSFELGNLVLNRWGLTTARRVTAMFPQARVVTNGGNCQWGDVNWAHCVHSAWPRVDGNAPAWFRAKNAFSKSLAIRNERRVFRAARIVIANSERTRRDLIRLVGVEASRIHLVYLGAEPTWLRPSSAEIRAAREKLGHHSERPLIVFVGALGLDNNKGFDTLWSAWQLLSQHSDWDAALFVAGAGKGLPGWKARAMTEGLSDSVKFIGFTEQVSDLLAAADLLVSPVRYEAYGLNVQEAICRGVPAMVSGTAGVAERFTDDLRPMLVPDPDNVSDLVERLLAWRSQSEHWKRRFEPLACVLRKHTWYEMARQIVLIANQDSQADEAIYACGSMASR